MPKGSTRSARRAHRVAGGSEILFSISTDVIAQSVIPIRAAQAIGFWGMSLSRQTMHKRDRTVYVIQAILVTAQVVIAFYLHYSDKSCNSTNTQDKWCKTYTVASLLFRSTLLIGGMVGELARDKGNFIVDNSEHLSARQETAATFYGHDVSSLASAKKESAIKNEEPIKDKLIYPKPLCSQDEIDGQSEHDLYEMESEVFADRQSPNINNAAIKREQSQGLSIFNNTCHDRVYTSVDIRPPSPLDV